jgi:hypothetical protein
MQFRQFLLAFFLVTVLVNCGGPPPADAPQGPRPFFVDDASYLYFKNLRVNDYSLEEQAEPRLDFYRHRRMATELAAPGLTVTLVDNWLEDEAYLQIELVDSSGVVAGPVTLTPDYPRTGATDRFTVGSGEPAAAVALARELRTALQQRRELTFRTDETPVRSLRIQAADFGPQLTTIKDYLRLIDE